MSERDTQRHDRVKGPILIPFTAVLLLMVGALLLTAYLYEEQARQHDLSNSVRAVERLFQLQIENQAAKLHATLCPVSRDAGIKAAFVSGDRHALLKEVAPLFERLRSQHRITHFYLTDAERRVVLRVHQPEMHGDVVARATARRAQETGKETQGIELGPLGTLTLRAVKPWYLPFLASGVLLAEAERKGVYRDFKILVILYLAALAKTLVSGFDLTTTVLIMATVPFVYHAIAHRWDLKTFLVRFLKASLALVTGTLTGMLILLIQINAGEAGTGSAYEYILNRFTSHLGGNYDYFYETGGDRPIGVFEVLPKYLLMPAIDLRVQGGTIQILYWHILLVFAFFTLVFLFLHRDKNGRLEFSPKSLALLATTWYSLLAPLSWYILFRPHAFIHTHVNTMGWQMPFTLLGFALCGYVITELVLRLRRQGAQSTSQAL